MHLCSNFWPGPPQLKSRGTLVPTPLPSDYCVDPFAFCSAVCTVEKNNMNNIIHYYVSS